MTYQLAGRGAAMEMCGTKPTDLQLHPFCQPRVFFAHCSYDSQIHASPSFLVLDKQQSKGWSDQNIRAHSIGSSKLVDLLMRPWEFLQCYFSTEIHIIS